MNNRERAKIAEQVLLIIQQLQIEPADWVDFARIGEPLVAGGIQYKQLGFSKLGLFLNKFQDILEFIDEKVDGKTPVYYVRPKGKTEPLMQERPKVVSSISPNTISSRSEKVPTKDSWLFNWAQVPDTKIKELSELALDEKMKNMLPLTRV